LTFRPTAALLLSGYRLLAGGGRAPQPV